MAIDSAKRNFEIEVEPELSKISHFACMKHKPQYPRFYAGVQKLKAKYSKRRRVEMLDSDIGDFNCPMDIIYRIIDKEVIDLRKNKNLIEETISLGTLVAVRWISKMSIENNAKRLFQLLTIIRR